MSGKPRPFVLFEIRARDIKRLAAFYSAMFDWEVDTSNPAFARIPGGYHESHESPPGGIIVAGDGGMSGYIQVVDLQASLARAEELGGSVLTQPFDVPNGPTIARIADPEGNAVGMVQL